MPLERCSAFHMSGVGLHDGTLAKHKQNRGDNGSIHLTESSYVLWNAAVVREMKNALQCEAK